MTHVRLYNKPKVNAGDGLPALAVDGAFPPCLPPGAYEGRLQIHSAIGDCRVQLLTGDLPPGYTLGVDNTTQEVVLRWPAYQADTVAIPNGNFESGNKDWDLGPGWTIESGVVNTDPGDPDGTYVAQYVSQGGDSLVFNKMAASVTPGATIHASCDVQQGASSKGNAGAAVRLRFLDEAGNPVGSDAEGNAIMSGSNAAWHTSSLAVTARTGKVVIGARGIRKRENRPLWIDNFQWDVKQATLGLAEDRGSIPLCLRVFDSVRRHADWCGTVPVFSGIAALDPASTTAAWSTLSNNNLTYVGKDYNSIVHTVLCDRPRTFGKIYWEVTAINGVPDQPRVTWGVDSHDPTFAATQAYGPGGYADGSGASVCGDGTALRRASHTAIGLPQVSTGNIIRLRFDIGAGLLEAAVNSGDWKTVSNTLSAGKTWRASVSSYYGGYYPEGGTFNFGATPFTYPVPDGYESGWLG